MKEYLSAVRRKRFCECYLRTLDPAQAARDAGERDGWAMLADDALEGAILEKAMENLGEEELMALKEGYERRAARRYPLRPQLPQRGQREEAPVSQAEFRV